MKFKKFIKTIQEKLDVVYSYSCLMANLPSEIAQKVIDFGKQIPDEEIYTNPNDDSFGRENDIHTTVFYGLTDENSGELRQFLKDFSPFDIKLGKVSVFDNKEEYDVLKIDVESDYLKKLHYAI